VPSIAPTRGFSTPIVGNQNVITSALPQIQAPGTIAQAPVPPAVAARERKNKKTDTKRREGTAARQVLSNLTPPPGTDPNAPPQQAQVNFTPAQYQAPKNDALRYIAAGLSLLFGGAPIGGAASSFLQGQNQKAQRNYQIAQQNAEQQYKVAQDQAAINYQNAKAKWDYGQDLRARGINPITNQPFQYQDPFTVAGPKATDQQIATAFTNAIGQAQRNGDTSAVQRFGQEFQTYQTQVKDRQNWDRFIMQQQFEDRRSANTQSNENQREIYRENREDARNAARINSQETKPLTPVQQIDLTTKADSAMREFSKSYSALTQPHTSASGIVVQPPLRGAIVNQLSGIFSMIRSSQDPQGLAEHLSSLTKDTNAQQLIQQAGDANALQRQARGEPIIPRSYANIPESRDSKLNALYQKAITHGLDVSSPQVMKAILHDAGFDMTSGGSNAAPPFPSP
jgi:hypothetical protein